MTQKWNLQDIRPVEPRKRKPHRATDTLNTKAQTSGYEPVDREDIPSVVIENGTNKAGNRFLISIFLFIAIVGGAVALSAFMGKTELTIYPKHRSPNVNAEFTAYPDKREGELSFEIMTLEATGESQVTASGQIDVTEQATGIIEIIKTTPGAERLIKNTRFRSPDGLVFRIQESVVVPGSITDQNGANVPGTIQAEVFADEAGEAYNLNAGTIFDIPGFKEGGFTELYNAITARNPQSFTGGFSGPQFKIDENELQTARQALQIELRNTLLARIANEKPADFIAFEKAVAFTYNELPAVQYGDNLVTIKEQAILQIPLFNANEFGSFIAEQTVTTYEGNPVRVADPNELTFSYSSATTSVSNIANEPSLSFNIAGKPQLIWEYDTANLTQDLAGLPKTAINNVISSYPGIDGAKVRITPFWKRTFPEQPDEILVIEELKEVE